MQDTTTRKTPDAIDFYFYLYLNYFFYCAFLY